MRNAFRTLAATALMTALLSGLPPVAFAAQARPAQQVQATPAPAPPVVPQQTFDDQNAQQTRERLREVLSQYPPSVGQVLRLDPTLLTRADYLAPYPALAGFLAQHPAVVHNPSYFLAFVRLTSSGGYMDTAESARTEGMRVIRDTFEGLFFLIGICWGIGMFGWLARSVIEYRAWLRASRVQTEIHTKMIDRLTSNEEVLAYAQSPVGQRFLSGTAMTTEFVSRSVGSPVGRILWSVQIGIVLALGGIGLLIAKNSIMDEAAQALYVVAVIAIALGIGFALSAVAAYVLSQRLGLLQPQSSSTHA